MTHRRALVVIAIAAALDLIGGIAFALVERLPIHDGLYWAVGVATTAGTSFAPTTGAGRILHVCVMLTVIPLFAASFSLITSALTTNKVSAHHEKLHAETMRHLRHIIDSSPDEIIPPLPDEDT